MYVKKKTPVTATNHIHEFSNYILIELSVIELQISKSFCNLSVMFTVSNWGRILVLECMPVIVGPRIRERYTLDWGFNFGS